MTKEQYLPIRFNSPVELAYIYYLENICETCTQLDKAQFIPFFLQWLHTNQINLNDIHFKLVSYFDSKFNVTFLSNKDGIQLVMW